MEEREIDNVLKPKKKLIILLIIYLSLAFVCIGLVFFMKFANKKEEAINISELVFNENEKVQKYIKLEIDTPPILMMPTSEKDNHFYYITDLDNHTYIISLSNETFKNILDTYNQETGKLNSTYQLTGITDNIDEQIKRLALSNSFKVFNNNDLTVDNFYEKLGEFYIKEESISERTVTLFTISALLGLFFFIIALGYIVPGIIKANKILTNEELVEELRIELGNLTDTPYKKQHIYLTKNYIVFGIQAINYKDIDSEYIEEIKSYGITAGKNLIIKTKDNKEHIVASVSGTKNNILYTILNDIRNRIE